MKTAISAISLKNVVNLKFCEFNSTAYFFEKVDFTEFCVKTQFSREINPLYNVNWFHEIFFTLITVWKFHYFLSLSFYVKSIFENLEVQKLPFLQILGLWKWSIW